MQTKNGCHNTITMATWEKYAPLEIVNLQATKMQ